MTATDRTARSSGVVESVERIGQDVAAAVADDVDTRARFPVEVVAALRGAGALAALVPGELGGPGVPVGDVAASVSALARYCASSAMILAMHHIQVACLARHGKTETLREFVADLVGSPRLLASATTEVGIGGDVRSSACAVHRSDGRFNLVKEAPVISYGAYADAVLATARRTADSPANDQVLVLCRPPGLRLDPTGAWDTLGFRGTCSPGFRLVAEGDESEILADPYGEISSRTMLPVAHVLWASVWLGIATAAGDRARQLVQADARRRPGTTPDTARRLAELVVVHQQFAELVRGGVRRYEECRDDPEALDSVQFAVAMNSLKVSASTLVVDIVQRAMLICGMAGYRQDTPYSLGRHLRDAIGASLMVNNDRILGNNAQLLLVHRGPDL